MWCRIAIYLRGPDTAIQLRQIAHQLEEAIGVAHCVKESHAERDTSASEARMLNGEDGVAANALESRVEGRQQYVASGGQVRHQDAAGGKESRRRECIQPFAAPGYVKFSASA